MAPNEKCGLCDSTENLDFYCGGPVGCICDKCKIIVVKWEEAKKIHDKYWRDERKKVRLLALKERTAKNE